ncbi:MAG: hypothetical protein M1827_003286 [Pycnora praestabilis]|nr:MAG: hypothetical protein M1827_003286 [Pycnora praestabilis]
MDEAEAALHQTLPAALRNLQPAALQALHLPHAHHGHTLASQLPPDLHGLDATDANVFQQRLHAELVEGSIGQNLHPANAFEAQHQQHRHLQNRAVQASGVQPHTPQQQRQQQHVGGQFGILTPGPQLASQSHAQHSSFGRLQQEQDLFQTPEQNSGSGKGHGTDNMKMVPDPPNLDEWRGKLFDVNDMITLSEDEYQTYFPHVDNIYSHRSTQKYKRKPFVSHYWDCRLKGRPPGTPKSDDPNKKKRKRTARQRDLCDVKIKITEYFPGAVMAEGFDPQGHGQLDASSATNFFAPGQPGGVPLQQQQNFGMLAQSTGGLPIGHPGAAGQRYYTIQRVNGNGGNGKGDGVAGPHKHTLEESDRVKKNSVQRYMLKEEKEKKKTQMQVSSVIYKRGNPVPQDVYAQCASL